MKVEGGWGCYFYFLLFYILNAIYYTVTIMHDKLHVHSQGASRCVSTSNAWGLCRKLAIGKSKLIYARAS